LQTSIVAKHELAEGKQPEDLLFGYHAWGWVREWVQRICGRAKVPVVCAHAMRGLHSTLAVETGVTSHAVAAALGHESISTTMTSYARPEAVQAARQDRVVSALSLRNEIPNIVSQRSDQEKGASHLCETPSPSVELIGIEPTAS